jgi:hypothetical protein
MAEAPRFSPPDRRKNCERFANVSEGDDDETGGSEEL